MVYEKCLKLKSFIKINEDSRLVSFVEKYAVPDTNHARNPISSSRYVALQVAILFICSSLRFSKLNYFTNFNHDILDDLIAKPVKLV